VSVRAGQRVTPVDISVDAAMKLYTAAAARNRTVTVISQHRFDPSSVVVHDAVSQGRLGTITTGVASVAWWRSQSYYDSGD
jgi:UDP-N-acetyl-2-amino-2-deoxyglucuronate dehydrogenase